MAGEPKNVPPFTNPPAEASGLPVPLTEQQIMDQATQSIDSQISSQVRPLQGQIETLGTQRDRTLGNVGTLFDSLQPVVTQSAKAVEDSYRNAEVMQNKIFATANQRLSQLKQDRASEAQRLAQQMGGPVAVGEFTAGLDPMIEAGTYLGAGQQLHTLGYAQAGQQQAEAFAGQVFPLVRTEETAKARGFFEDQIKDIRSQIEKVNSTRSGLISDKQAQLHKQNLEYQLQVASQKLDNVKANRDWQATQRSLKNDEARIELARGQFKLDRKTTKANITHLTKADKLERDRLGLSNKQFAAAKAQGAANRRLATQKIEASRKVTAAGYLDAAVNPQPGKTITRTDVVEIPPPKTGQKAPENSWPVAGKDELGNPITRYYKTVKTVDTATTQPITDPGALVDYLVAHGVKKANAISMVKTRLRIPNWVYGQGNPAARIGNARHRYKPRG